METIKKSPKVYGYLDDTFWDDLEDDIYANYEKCLEDDEIRASEAGFMRGLELEEIEYE